MTTNKSHRPKYLNQFTWLLVVISTIPTFIHATEHIIQPTDSPQEILDKASAGDRLIFTPGNHEHGLGRHNSLLYVDKPIEIELQDGAVLKLADKQTVLEKEPEITIDHGMPKKLDDFQVGGGFQLSTGWSLFYITIDSEGGNGKPDTFQWRVRNADNPLTYSKVPITGDWQKLTQGVAIRFGKTTGHSIKSRWILSYDGPESYGIRIGYGTQKKYIENVRIFGKGTIDLNGSNNITPSGFVKNINACVLVHGRVRNVSIEDVTMVDTMRSVMIYGEHTGKFLKGGATGPGESFDAENINIQYTRTMNPKGSGYLLGHPSHRGLLKRVICNYNYMETLTTSIEPNFQLDSYEVIGNIIKSGGEAIHCWRKSTNGVVADNIRIGDFQSKQVVHVNSPGAWEKSVNITTRNNQNLLSDRVKPPPFWKQKEGTK